MAGPAGKGGVTELNVTGHLTDECSLACRCSVRLAAGEAKQRAPISFETQMRKQLATVLLTAVALVACSNGPTGSSGYVIGGDSLRPA
jgi:hypothetical protein